MTSKSSTPSERELIETAIGCNLETLEEQALQFLAPLIASPNQWVLAVMEMSLQSLQLIQKNKGTYDPAFGLRLKEELKSFLFPMTENVITRIGRRIVN